MKSILRELQKELQRDVTKSGKQRVHSRLSVRKGGKIVLSFHRHFIRGERKRMPRRIILREAKGERIHYKLFVCEKGVTNILNGYSKDPQKVLEMLRNNLWNWGRVSSY
jgi:hypothetical protein